MLKPTRNKRRIAALAGALALSTCLALGLAGCANSEGNGAAEPTAPATEQEANADAQAAAEAESGAITFTDDLGRTVELPAQIDKICPSASRPSRCCSPWPRTRWWAWPRSSTTTS